METDLFGDIPPGTTITAIRPLESDPNVRSVRAGKRVVARLRAIDVETLGLEIGREWTRDLAETVEAARQTEVARRAALRMLGRRAYSVAEITERLKRADHGAAAVARVVEEFVDGGWLDDEAYARAAASKVVERRPAAQPLVVHELCRRGIDADLAERVARDLLGDRDEVGEAQALALRLLRSQGAAPADTGRSGRSGPSAVSATARRIGRALARRGFDETTVHTVLHRLGLADDGDQTLEADDPHPT